jgi:hypothetical protein
MRLISLHADTVQALERLHIPFDDLTPDGLWGSPYHLLGLTAEQRAVLDSWNLKVNDVTPAMLGSAHAAAPMLKTSAPPRGEAKGEAKAEGKGEAKTEAPSASQSSNGQSSRDASREGRGGGWSVANDTDAAHTMTSEPKHHGDPLGDAAAERAIVGEAAAQAEAGGKAQAATEAAGANGGNGGAAATPRRNPSKLRVSIGGKYREAAVKKGKIVLDGQTYDTPAEATKSVAPAKGDWVFWEYFDSDAGKWRMLDRDWRPGLSA